MDKELRWQLLRAAIRDRKFLKDCYRDLLPSFFPTQEEQTIAEAAVSFYTKYEDPIGPLLSTEVAEIAVKEKFGNDTREKLKTLVTHLQGTKMELVSIAVLTDKLKTLKRHSFHDNAVDEILTAKEQGKFNGQLLSDIFDRFRRELDTGAVILHNYLEELEPRIVRRARDKNTRYPLLLIDPLDEKTDIIGRGHLGMVMAPPGGGKGLALVKIGVAYAMQGLNVLHITLEDPKSLVEDRLDASLSGIALPKLKQLPKTLRKRFRRIKEQMRGRLKIIDGTDGSWTVTQIEKVLEQAKREGFTVDALIIDYDDEIVCEKKFTGESARRNEFSEIYKRLRKLAADNQIIVWTAAQSTRASMGKKEITGKDVAEDFSKIRKVFFAMGIGSDSKREGVKYLYIIKNRLGGRAGFGVEIMSDWDCALFYDPEATRLMIRAKRLEAKAKAKK